MSAIEAMADEPEPRHRRPEREETDESLRAERTNTDSLLKESRTRVEESADRVVSRARRRADAVLDSARADADEKLDAAEARPQARDAVARERAGEDEVLKDERAAADDSLRRERQEQARTLAALLPLEREKTDRHLLTERARSDDALQHRDDFMGIVSHDLRNLLGAIAESSRLLALQASASDEGKRTVGAMQRMQRYIARMNRLIGDLVDVASIDEGKLALNLQPSDAAALISEAAGAFAQNAQDKGIELTVHTNEAPIAAVFDSERMLQVLANLIANAMKFTPRGGTIAVSGERTGDELLVTVLDTGIGIADDKLDAVFERFWQVGKNDHRGLGLGLYISRCIVDAHGGRIWAESTPGTGSGFRFTIPLRNTAGA